MALSKGNLHINLTIFILCHNRTAFAKQTINSVLAQTNREFRLIISDNSTNEELSGAVRSEFPALELRRRVPSLSSADHFNQCISEVETDYFCLFHDDDLMKPDFVDSMLGTIKLYPMAVAYSCNAVIIDEANKPQRTSFESDAATLIIEGPHSLAGRYFSRFPNGIAPFPAYIYRSEVIKGIPINPQAGGKYSDVTWLLDISRRGSIVWNAKTLIQYRMHSTNDGGIESTRDRLRLLGYLKANVASVGQDIIDDYRFFLYKKLRNNGSSDRKVSSRSAGICRRYLLQYRLRRFFQLKTYAYLYYKSAKKLR